MARLIWDQVGEKTYETGVDHGVYYQQDPDGSYPSGVAWNGLTNVNETSSGAESSPLFADNIKYLNLLSAEEFSATIEAYTYPPEFEASDGQATIAPGVKIAQQSRRPFGFCYRTLKGNDTMGTDYGYKIHIVYNAQAAPSDRSYGTVSDSPDAITFSWEITTTPVPVTGAKPTALLIIDSNESTPEKMAALEKILYGDVSTEARLPMPDEIATLMAAG